MTATPAPSSRLLSIDQFRGLAILLMVLANFLAGVELVPAWLKHAPDVGLTVIDLIAPFFIFAIGLTYRLSWNRRLERQGLVKASQHFITRFMAIIGIGAVLSAGEIWLQVDGTSINWGVLQAIGVAGILALLVIGLPTVWRLLVGVAILAVYQYMLDTSWLSAVLNSPHGGLPGSISWGAMLILATVFAGLFHDPGHRKLFAPASLAAILLGIALSFVLPLSKNRVSSSYVLVSLGISALLFFLLDWLTGKRNISLALLVTWGKNPLVLYVLHLLLIGIFFLPDIPAWYSAASLWLVLLEALFLLASLSAVGLWLERRQIIVSL